MANDEERLVVALEARIRDFEKNMLKAERTGTQSYTRLRRGSQTATQQMEQDAIRSSARINQAFATVGTTIGAFGKSFGTNLLGTVAGLGIAGIVGSLREVAGSVAAIGDEAKRAGIGIKAFQELRFVAEQNRIGVDALTDGIKEMNLRADEFILTGKGSSAEAFQRLGLDSETLARKLKDPSALFTEIIGKLGQLDKAAQIRIADEIFGGTGGEKFVQLIEQGESGIRETIQAANDLGIVMDEQVIARAAEVDRRFNLIANTVGSALKSAIVSAADSLATFIDGFRDFQNQMSSTLKDKQAELGMRRLDLETKIFEKMQEQREETEKLSSVANDLGFETSKNTAVAGVTGQITALKEELRQLAEEEAQVVNVLNGRIKPMDRSGNGTWTPPAPSTIGNSGTKGKAASTAATDRERQGVTDLISELEEELQLVNASDEAKRRAAASRQAGASATSEERDRIISLTEAIHRETEQRDAAIKRMEFAKDVTRGVIDDLISGTEEGKSAWESMGDAAVNALKRISQSMTGDLLDSIFKVNNASAGSGGILGSIIGNLFSPQFRIASSGGIGMYASGTNFAPGGAAIVGERGPELVNLPRGSRVVPNHALTGMASGATVAAPVSINIVNNAPVRVDAKEETDERGGRRVEFILEEQVASALTRPGSAAGRALRTGYGMGQRLTKR